MAQFTITNCGEVDIDVGGVTTLGPTCCFGWLVTADAPVVLKGEGAKYFITHAAPEWEPDIRINALGGDIIISVGTRTEILTLSSPVTLSLDGV